jgi:hypothetical protein
LYLELKPDAGLKLEDVRNKFGAPTEVDVPTPNPVKSLVLIYKTPRGRMTFGIGHDDDKTVVSASIDRSE